MDLDLNTTNEKPKSSKTSKYLAAYKGIWGPHLIIVPTSTMLNWECEFKRFCPSMKVLTYYGSLKERQV